MELSVFSLCPCPICENVEAEYLARESADRKAGAGLEEIRKVGADGE